jgi:threonine aldolase
MSTNGVVDLRSDTVTKPSAGMRQAMAESAVGDDILDGDPTTRKLEETVAALCGKDSALFFPSGTQANQTAIWLHSQRGTELILEAEAHLVHYEKAGVAGLAGVQIRPVATPDGVLTAESIKPMLRHGEHEPEVSAIAVENTHNRAGGKVMPLEIWDELIALSGELGLPVHLDGARLWNAAAAIGEPPARVARGAASVSVCLSKGLGCPVGSCLAGDAATINRAKSVRRRFGGAMRQSGILAAAGLYALEHNLPGLVDDHTNAKLFAQRLVGHPKLQPTIPDTNIIMLDLMEQGLTAEVALAKLAEAGVLLVPFGPTRLRAVTHLDVSEDEVRHAAEVVAEVFGE